MANWISSKLKVAETFFEQIDQQAAESLKKNERSLGSEDQKFHVPAKGGEGGVGGGGGIGTVPLKDQLKKKTTHETNINNSHEYFGKLNIDPNIDNANYYSKTGSNIKEWDKEITNASRSSPKPKPTLTDNDWTELLSTPIQTTPSSLSNRSNGASSAVRGLNKNGRRPGNLTSNMSVLEGKKNVRNSGVKTKKGLDIASDKTLNGKPCDEEGSSSSAGSSSVELQGDSKLLDREELNNKDVGSNLMENQIKENLTNSCLSEFKNMSHDDLLPMGNKNHSLQLSSVSEKVDRVSDVEKGVDNAYDRLRSTVKGKHQSGYASRSSISDDLKKGFSTSDGGSYSDSDSVSSSDSESEREREMRKKILADKAAAKAVEAIKERENMVARLEGEKQCLEKILEEREKQQAQEASELQTTMMETMEAVELEKQKHNNTRMEALARLAILETANADLSRSLATAQKNLEVEINRVAELRQQFELKEVAHEELRRKIFKTDHSGIHLSQGTAAKGVEFEREILEAEYYFLTDKIGILEDKAKELEADIEMTKKDIEDPTEVEIELKRRLAQLTDHLIQKQAQVEALSSEKATLLFRIEAVSRSLNENNTNSRDLESGAREIPDSKLSPLFEEKIRSGRKHLGSLVMQLDAIFMAGAIFVRRNPAAKLWSVAYLVCLHFWVIYIFLSHSQVSNEGSSGAIISLGNINNTSAV